jgi:hypothetical protein
VLSYVIGGALTSRPSFQLLNLGSATITMIGKSFSASYLTWQAAIFVGTGLAFVLLRVRPRSGLRIPSTGAAVAAVIALAVIGAAPTTLPSERYVADPHPPTLCMGTKPQICLYPEHRRYATAVEQPIDTLARAAEADGYTVFVPDKIIEESRTYKPSGPGVLPLYLPSEVYDNQPFSLMDAASALLTPGQCAFVQDPSIGGVNMDDFTQRYFSLLGTWLHLVGVDDIQAPVTPKLLTPAEAATIMTDFGRCDLDGRS